MSALRRRCVSSVASGCAMRGHLNARLVTGKERSGWCEPIIHVTTVAVVFFPLDRRLQLSRHTWSPQTIQQAVRLAVEIPSHRRAAAAFSELTGVALSKSS